MENWWPADLHVIGKNITRFHCLYWPAMLMSAGLPLPKQVFAHGFMPTQRPANEQDDGQHRDPDEMADDSASTASATPSCARSRSSATRTSRLDGFVRRYNADLANDLGNLVNRTVSMTNRYLAGSVPSVTDATQPADLELRATAESTVERYHGAMAEHRLSDALAAMMDLAGAANGYAEGQAPWALDKAGATERVGHVLAAMAEACRIIGHLLAPVAPSSARRACGRRSTSSCCCPSRAAPGTCSATRWSPRRSTQNCCPANGCACTPPWPAPWKPAWRPGTLRRAGPRGLPTTGQRLATSHAPWPPASRPPPRPRGCT